MNSGCSESRFGPAFSILMAVVAACSASRPTMDQAGAEPTAQNPPSQDPGSPPVEPSAVPSGVDPERACSRDDECILSTFPGCCSCCQCAPLHALRADAERRWQDSCALEKCAAQDCSAASCVPCGSVAATVRAACVGGLCSVVP